MDAERYYSEMNRLQIPASQREVTGLELGLWVWAEKEIIPPKKSLKEGKSERTWHTNAAEGIVRIQMMMIMIILIIKLQWRGVNERVRSIIREPKEDLLG